MIGINLSEPADRVKRYVTEMQLTFPVVIDASGELARAYGVRFTPTHVLIDGSGVVRAAGAGGRDWNSLTAREAVRALLEVDSTESPTATP